MRSWTFLQNLLELPSPRKRNRHLAQRLLNQYDLKLILKISKSTSRRRFRVVTRIANLESAVIPSRERGKLRSAGDSWSVIKMMRLHNIFPPQENRVELSSKWACTYREMRLNCPSRSRKCSVIWLQFSRSISVWCPRPLKMLKTTTHIY